MIVRIIRSITWETGRMSATFRKDVELPFAPCEETVLTFGEGTLGAGPFARVIYNCEEQHFVCTTRTLTVPSADRAKELIYQFTTELWTRIK